METNHLALKSALHALDRAEALLAIAARHDLLGERLAPDMWTLRQQLFSAIGFTRRAVLPLNGIAPERVEADLTEDGLRAAIFAARAEIAAADGPTPERIAHVAGEATLDQTAEDYLATFALPNLWFHLSMAYAILRAAGVDIGKADFDGLHVYS